MAELTADNADILRQELKKTLTVIFHEGGETDENLGVSQAIDEAIRILKFLKEVEFMEVYSPPPTSVVVPKEFKCLLSNTIMSEPVVISSGHTYEKESIIQWMLTDRTCPKTKQVISDRIYTPNHLINEMIVQWCGVNEYVRPKPSDVISFGMSIDDINSLLDRISSPSSVEDQTEAAKELRRQTKKFSKVRLFFVTRVSYSIERLLSPFSALDVAVDSNPELQKNIITTLFNISTVVGHKPVIANYPLVIPLLTKSLKHGQLKTRKNSAAALCSLSFNDHYKIIIGNSETLKALIDLIKEDDFLASTEAACAVHNLCTLVNNKTVAVSEGLIHVLMDKIKVGSNVDFLIDVLLLVSTEKRAVEEMEDLGFVHCLLSIMRNPRFTKTGEKALEIVYNMYKDLDADDRDRELIRLKVVYEEQNNYATFIKIWMNGSDRAIKQAQEILQWLKKSQEREESK